MILINNKNNSNLITDILTSHDKAQSCSYYTLGLFCSNPWKKPQHSLFLRAQPFYLLKALKAIVRYSNWPKLALFYGTSVGKTDLR